MARQPRLFDPGPKGPDRWKLHPDKWVQGENVVYHVTGQKTLPREDRGGDMELAYGESRGMHFGDKATAISRGNDHPSRKYVHTARLDSPQFSEIMTDHDANYSRQADDWVKGGGTVRYRNEFEGNARRDDNISFRVLPERTKTWSEDVKADPNAHPALQHLAEKGYNPTVMMPEARAHIDAGRAGANLQPQLFGADLVKHGKTVSVHVDAAEAFDAMESYKHKPGGTIGMGVKRNNLRDGWWESEAASQVPTRLRRD